MRIFPVVVRRQQAPQGASVDGGKIAVDNDITHPPAEPTDGLVLAVGDTHPVPFDTNVALVAAPNEMAVAPVTVELAAVFSAETGAHPAAVDFAGIAVAGLELAPPTVDVGGLVVAGGGIHPAATPTELARAVAVEAGSNPAPIDVEAIVAAALDTMPDAVDAATALITLRVAGTLDGAGTGNWQNPANSNGRTNGTDATMNRTDLFVDSDGTLAWTYPNPNVADLTITQVQVKVYWQGTGSASTGDVMDLDYSLNNGGTWTSLSHRVGAAGGGTFNQNTRPEVFDITGAVADFKARVHAHVNTGAGLCVARVDACELIVTASKAY